LSTQRLIHQLYFASLRTAFHLLYHQFAWTYDAISAMASLGQWRNWQSAAIPYIRGSDILELGHGPGHMLLDLAAQGYRPVGLDLSPQMGRMARKRLLGERHFLNLVRGRSQTLPFGPQSFDTIVATFPTPYIIAPETAVAIHRVLRPGGRLVIVPEARLTGKGLLNRWLEWLYRITGQRHTNFRQNDINETYWCATFTGFGFDVASHLQNLENSEVMIVIAERTAVH
jgi:ubiquinone/menaquinone biosynthesis C-methylase UbiE